MPRRPQKKVLGPRQTAQVRSIAKRVAGIGVEMKERYLFGLVNPSNPLSTAQPVQQLADMSQGPANGQRIGESIRLKSTNFRFSIANDSGVPAFVRVVILGLKSGRIEDNDPKLTLASENIHMNKNTYNVYMDRTFYVADNKLADNGKFFSKTIKRLPNTHWQDTGVKAHKGSYVLKVYAWSANTNSIMAGTDLALITVKYSQLTNYTDK